MVGRSASTRAFFWIVVGSACAVASACTSSPEWSQPDAASQGQERAEKWREQGLYSMAARQLEESGRLATEADDPSTAIACWVDAAQCWLLERQPGSAAAAVDRAERLVTRLPPNSSRARVAKFQIACGHGDVAAVTGRNDAAQDAYEEALECASGRERDLVAMRLSLLAERKGDRRNAKRYAGQLKDPNDPRLAELRRMLQREAPAASAAPAAKAAAVASRNDIVVPKGPPILPRNAWGARRSRPNADRMTKIWRITVHHTATRLAGSSSRIAADAIQDFQREHQEKKGWADIGYHFVIDPSGRIWEGRPLAWQGAHAGSPDLNVGNAGVALIGDFTLQQPTASQKKALTELLDSLCARHDVKRSHVYTHQEIRPDPTDCPGPALQRVVASWRRSGLTTW